MTRQQAALVRLLLMCAAWAVGTTLGYAFSQRDVGLILSVALAIGVYILTEDLGKPRYDGGNVRYWRGRRIDDN